MGSACKSIILSFGKMLELENADDGIIALSIKMSMKHCEHRSQVKFGLKMSLICNIN
jgi:hypothetical protein